MDIAILGDSLTEGRPGAAYFPLLQDRLPCHRLFNHGRAGDTVADLRARMRHTRLARVDLTVVWIGANDIVMESWGGYGGGWAWTERLARLRTDYDELLEWAGRRADRLLLVKPIVLETQGSLWTERTNDLGAVIEGLATLHDMDVLDLAPAFAAAQAAGRGPFTIDGVHFTDAGAQVVAAAFAAAVERAG